MIKHKIVLVPFPFDDFSHTKVRPALCITNTVGKFQHVVIAFISSKIPIDIEDTDIFIFKTHSGFSKTGLITDSVIRIHKIISIPQNLILRELGFADETIANEIAEKIKLLFA